MAFCNSCGATLDAGTKFCNKCGAGAPAASVPAASTPAAAGTPAQGGGGSAVKIILIVVAVIVGLGTGYCRDRRILCASRLREGQRHGPTSRRKMAK